MGSDILDLKGRIGLITGAGQGVGRAAALHFAQHNAGVVVVNDFYLDRAQAVAAEVEKAGCKALAVQCDVTSFESVTAMFEKVRAECGGVDILVNNAGNWGADPSAASKSNLPFWQQTPSAWDPFLNVNLFGVMYCVRAALPGMIEKKYGKVVNVISDAGRVGEPNLEAYSAAKAGAAGFTRAIAKATGRFGIAANCVALASTRTPINEEQMKDEQAVKAMLSRYVIRRVGQPEDAANMILFLASDASSWITGQTYPVNGGYSFAV
jgi:3-oxoacyl-[acyl-carrier protein] reductase